MTLAWYDHLRFKNRPVGLAIVASWGIALAEYIFQVPVNRLGAEHFTLTQLQVTQECRTLAGFTTIALLLFGESPRWNILIAYVLIVSAVYFAFRL
jgi:uncharacterized protein (DUF486 family)